MKEAIQKLVRDLCAEKDAKALFAEFAGLSPSATSQFIYKGKGSAGTYIDALLFSLSLHESDVVTHLTSIKDIARRRRVLKKSDKLWFELDDDMNEEEKLYWVAIVKHAVKLKRENL